MQCSTKITSSFFRSRNQSWVDTKLIAGSLWMRSHGVPLGRKHISVSEGAGGRESSVPRGCPAWAGMFLALMLGADLQVGFPELCGDCLLRNTQRLSLLWSWAWNGGNFLNSLGQGWPDKEGTSSLIVNPQNLMVAFLISTTKDNVWPWTTCFWFLHTSEEVFPLKIQSFWLPLWFIHSAHVQQWFL